MRILLLVTGSSVALAFAPATPHGPTASAITDLTQIGSLTVPTIGCGTIAWSTDVADLEELVSNACKQGGGFFNTGERYGSHAKTALGMGWGETECLVSKLIRDVDIDSSASKPVVATKFTPSPWRKTADSVVEACEESRKRLGVESIDLYQIQMPDIVKVCFVQNRAHYQCIHVSF